MPEKFEKAAIVHTDRHEHNAFRKRAPPTRGI